MAALGDAASRHALLTAIRDEGGGIGIEDRIVAQPQTVEQLGSQAIVRGFQAGQVCWPEPPQECPQRIAVREVRQPQEEWDQPVVNEGFGVLDAANPGHNHHHMRQKQVHGLVVPIEVRRPSGVELQEVPHTKRLAKLVKEDEATETGQPRRIDEKLERPRTSGHLSQSYRKGSFVSSPNSRR